MNYHVCPELVVECKWLLTHCAMETLLAMGTPVLTANPIVKIIITKTQSLKKPQKIGYCVLNMLTWEGLSTENSCHSPGNRKASPPQTSSWKYLGCFTWKKRKNIWFTFDKEKVCLFAGSYILFQNFWQKMQFDFFSFMYTFMFLSQSVL